MSGDKCGRCGTATRLADAGPTTCDGCGAGLFAIAGRLYDAAAYPRRIDAAEVPLRLAAALHDWRAASGPHLVEVQRLSLPYWQDVGGDLIAAFPSLVDAARRRRAPVAEPAPARIERLPRVGPERAEANPRRLVVVPAWDVIYEIRGRRWHAIVDAHDGTVMADLHPHPHEGRLQLAAGGVLLADVAAFAAVAYLAADNLWRTVLLSALAVPVYFATKAVLRVTDRRRV